MTDPPSVTVHVLYWADEPDRPEDDYVAAVFTTEAGLRDHVADVALQGVTVVGAHQAPVQLYGTLPAVETHAPAHADGPVAAVARAWAAMPDTADVRARDRPNDWCRADLRRTVPDLAAALDALALAGR